MNADSRNRTGWLVLRVTLAGVVAAHGYHRLLTGGSAPFGEWLNSQGIPFGPVIAWSITIFEVTGFLALALGRFVFPITIALSTIYLAGLFMVHAPNGWFVVGAGRNGVEFSVLLIVCLLCVGWQYAPTRSEGANR